MITIEVRLNYPKLIHANNESQSRNFLALFEWYIYGYFYHYRFKHQLFLNNFLLQPCFKSSQAIGPPTTTTETPLATDLGVVNPVHPLPLPPGVVIHPPSSSPRCKPDSVSRNLQTQNQWRKGKLIGRGTFGSVYVGSNRYVFNI